MFTDGGEKEKIVEDIILKRGKWQCDKCLLPISTYRHDRIKGKCQCNVEPFPEICKEHRPKNKEMGYVEHHNWMDEQTRKGIESKQCPKCLHWLFPCEW